MFGYIFLALIAMHFVADFMLQTHWQASNKSRDNAALTQHILIYTVAMTIGFSLVTLGFKIHLFNSFNWGMVAAFAGITFVTHWCTDYITSRISSGLFAVQDWHNFFVVVGFDQLVHYATLFLTLYVLGIYP